MGWNKVLPNNKKDIFKGFDEEIRFYFVHSYHVICKDKLDILATSNYGYDFTCCVKKNNIYGVQFHPEKSHDFGVLFFKNFLSYINYD